MQGISDLFASERGVFCIVLVLAATALVVFNKMTIDVWLDFAKWIGTVLVASKTVTGVIETMKRQPAKALPSSPS